MSQKLIAFFVSPFMCSWIMMDDLNNMKVSCRCMIIFRTPGNGRLFIDLVQSGKTLRVFQLAWLVFSLPSDVVPWIFMWQWKVPIVFFERHGESSHDALKERLYISGQRWCFRTHLSNWENAFSECCIVTGYGFVIRSFCNIIHRNHSNFISSKLCLDSSQQRPVLMVIVPKVAFILVRLALSLVFVRNVFHLRYVVAASLRWVGHGVASVWIMFWLKIQRRHSALFLPLQTLSLLTGLLTCLIAFMSVGNWSAYVWVCEDSEWDSKVQFWLCAMSSVQMGRCQGSLFHVTAFMSIVTSTLWHSALHLWVISTALACWDKYVVYILFHSSF